MSENDARNPDPSLEATIAETIVAASDPLTVARRAEEAFESESTAAASGVPILGGRYEIVGLLGSGGMGTVYRARDRELDEVVALKVLKGDVARASHLVERFRREVKLARKVTHRNVVRTFDIGEDGADRFLTMEYVEGEALSTIAHRAGKLAPGRVVIIGREICEGLAASHDAGVIHGDLKPENVLLARDGRVVITDFGIARALVPDANDPRTAAGMFVGTPAYMAPEQVEGIGPIDGRVDIYALGCMLYRLLTGEPAWSGTSFVSLAAARLLRAPPDPRGLLPEIPEPIAAVVRKCMARDRQDRFATAREVAIALADATASSTASTLSAERPKLTTMSLAPRTGSPKAVAVLPIRFQGAQDDAYLGASLTDDLIDVLSAVPLIRVRPRGATARFSGAEQDPRDVGRDLGVDAIIEGSVRRNGDLLRATLRLLTVEDGFQLWAARFERPPSAFLSIADEAAAAIAGVLASEKVAAPRESPTDSMALDLYLRGRYVYTRNYFDTAQAVALLRAAHERAPRDGRIAASYALALMRQYTVDALPIDVVDTSQKLAKDVLAKDPNVAEAHIALMLAHLATCDYRDAALELKRALAVSPTNADALAWHGHMLIELDRPREALELYRQAVAADANMKLLGSGIARAHAFLGEWDMVEETLAPVASDARGGDQILQWLVRARLALWRGDRAIAANLLRELEADRIPELAKARASRVLQVARDRELSPAAEQQLETELRVMKVPRRTAFNTQLKIELLLGAGLIERAKEQLLLLELNVLLDLTWLRRCPMLEPIRDDARFAALEASTAARVERVLEVLDEGMSGLRRSG